MWKRIYLSAFEASVGVFVIINGLLTLSPDSAIKQSLWNIMGFSSVIIPWSQVIAGTMKLIGILYGKSNLEVAGLISVAAMFTIRAIGLVADGEVSLTDLNSLTICAGIIASNLIRIAQIITNVQIVAVKVKK